MLDAPHWLHRHADTQSVVLILLIEIGEVDPNRNTLHDLHVVARRIFRWEEAERRTGSSANLLDHTRKLPSAKSVDFNLHFLARLHLLQLSLLEVGGNPEVLQRNDRHQRLADAQVLSRRDALATDNARNRSNDLGVAKIQLRLVDLSLRLLNASRSRIGVRALHGDLLG